MEVITGLLSDLWNGFKTLTIPILDIHMDEFLIGLFVVKFAIDILNFLLGKSLGDWENEQKNVGTTKKGKGK